MISASGLTKSLSPLSCILWACHAHRSFEARRTHVSLLTFVGSYTYLAAQFKNSCHTREDLRQQSSYIHQNLVFMQETGLVLCMIDSHDGGVRVLVREAPLVP